MDHHDLIASRISAFSAKMSDAIARRIYPYGWALQELDGPWIVANGRRMLNMASYSYLGLIHHPKIMKAAAEAMSFWGTGTHGVRLLAGTLGIHKELERSIAHFKCTEDALVFPSGYAANMGVLSALLGNGDIVITDRLDHASIVDGCILSRARVAHFNHNDMGHLEQVLKENLRRESRLVVVDAVFSMDGDVINLPDVVALCRRYDAWLMVDEAHSIGVLGRCGRGIAEHFDLTNCIDVQMGTFSKAIPSLGGYVAGSSCLVNFLRHFARPYIFSASLPASCAAAAKAGLEVILEEPSRIAALRLATAVFHEELRKAGFNILNTTTPIVPIVIGDEEKTCALARSCQEGGLFVLPILPPAVPDKTSRLRVTVTADHTVALVKQAVEILRTQAKNLGLL